MKKLSFLLLLSTLGSTLATWAQVPCQDYGRNGVAVAPASFQTEIRDLTLDSQGGWVMAGMYEDGAGKQLAVMRFLPDGLPDYRFGDGNRSGVVPVFAQLSENGRAYQVGISNAGNIIVSGGSPTEGGLVARNPNGSGYGFGGRSQLFYHLASALGPAGSLVDNNTVYAAYPVTDSRLQLISFSAQGDTVFVFGDNGIVEVETGFTLSRTQPPHLIKQADGKLLVAVAEAPNVTSTHRVMVCRFLPDGTLDPDYGNGGLVELTEVLPLELNELALQADGKLLVVASNVAEGSLPDANFAVAYRLTLDGSLDNSYGNNGRSPYGSDLAAGGAFLAADGRLWLAGFRDGPNGNELLIGAWDSTGTPDPSVGQRSYWPASATGQAGRLYGLRQLPDGTWVAWGYVMVDDEARRGLLLRLDANGNPLTSFGKDGFAYADLAEIASILDMEYATLTGVYAFGGVSTNGARGSDAWPVIGRFQLDGSPDSSFGKRGVAVFDMGESRTIFHTGMQHILPGSQFGTELRLFAAGTYDRVNGMLASRFFPDGRPDSTFGGDGFVEHRAICFNCNTFSSDAMALPDGYVLAGAASSGSGNIYTDAVLMKLRPDGQKDNDFSWDGELVLDRSIYREEFTQVDTLAGGNLIAAGYRQYLNQGIFKSEIFTARVFRVSGQLRQSYGDSGLVRINLGGSDDRFTDLQVQDGNKVVLAYYHLDDQDRDSARVGLLRLEALGDIDRNFGDTGWVHIQIPNVKRYYGLTLTPRLNDTLLVSGYLSFLDGGGNASFIAQYDHRGRPVSSFGDDGVLIITDPATQISGPPLYFPATDRFLIPGSIGNYYGFSMHCLDLNANATPVDPVAASPPEPLRVYPNPATRRLHATWPEPLPQAATLSLLDMQGRLLQRVSLPPGRQAWQGNVADYPPGLYLLRLQMGTEVRVQRWLR